MGHSPRAGDAQSGTLLGHRTCLSENRRSHRRLLPARPRRARAGADQRAAALEQRGGVMPPEKEQRRPAGGGAAETQSNNQPLHPSTIDPKTLAAADRASVLDRSWFK